MKFPRGDTGAVGSAADPTSIAFPATATDAFGRLRVSQPTALFDSKLTRGLSEILFWDESTTGTGSSTHDSDRSSQLLEVSASADEVIRQSKQRMAYQPGKSLKFTMTCVMPTTDANVRVRLGWFDANDGVFFEHDGTDAAFVLRTSTSGSPSDASKVTQSSWSVDSFDGTGPSGITLDFSAKNLLMWCDLQWLSVGRVRIGFTGANGEDYCAHEFRHSNLTSVAYMKNAHLPVRYEITATGAPGAARTLEAICCDVTSEGGFEPIGLPTFASTLRTGNAGVNATWEELIAIRVTSANVAAVSMHLIDWSVMTSTGGNLIWALVLNASSMGTGAWSSAGAQSAIEQNTTRGAWTYGAADHVLRGGYFSNDLDASQGLLNSKWFPGSKIDGTADVISVMAANASAGTNETTFAGLNVSEVW